MQARPPESIIAADIGSTFTHVCLLDTVEGVSRFVARAQVPTTLGEPERDLMIGLRRAVERLEHIVQRPLLDQGGQIIIPEEPSGAGVDAFVATSSAAPPLRCVIVGLTEGLSLESAQRACSTANVVVAQTLAVDTRSQGWDDQVVTSLHQTPPDLILLVGGADTGPVAPLEGAARVLAIIYGEIEAERRPVIVFAGNQEARRSVADVLSPMFDLRVVNNVRPNVHVESLGELQRELSELYERIKLAALPGYRRLDQWCISPVISTVSALSNALRFMACRKDTANGVLGIDVGGATTFVGAARGQVYQWSIGVGLGTSYGIGHVVEDSGLDAISRWLLPSAPAEEALDHLENARLRPHSIAQSTEDLLLTHAIVRQAVLLTMRHVQRRHWLRPGSKLAYNTTPAFDLIAARGGAITDTPQHGIVALSLLDAIQPVGLTRLVVDWASLWPQLGAIAAVAPLSAAQVLERDSLRELGTIVAPVGRGRRGRRALQLKIIHDDGEVVEVDLPAGVIQCFPLAPGRFATIEARPSRNFDIGLGRAGLGGRARVQGGTLGIIVDTRGRPLIIPKDAQEWRTSLQQWLGSLHVNVGQSS